MPSSSRPAALPGPTLAQAEEEEEKEELGGVEWEADVGWRGLRPPPCARTLWVLGLRRAVLRTDRRWRRSCGIRAG